MVRVHACGQEQGVPYLVLELAQGDLLQRLQRGPLPAAEAATLVRDLARGLAHVHARGVLHRDLKPHNVLFDERGAPKLVDFGLALLAGEGRLTRTGELVGTPAYMAPEQLLGRPVDERTDVYGLGGVLYHALTGRPPFVGQVGLALLQQVVQEDPPRVRSLAPETPRALEAVCAQCLHKDPAARPPSAAALAEALERALAASPARRGRWVLAGALGVVALAIAAWWRAPGPAEGPAEGARPTTSPLPLASASASADSSTSPHAPVVASVPRGGGWALRIRREQRVQASRPEPTALAFGNREAGTCVWALYEALGSSDAPQARLRLHSLRALSRAGIPRAQVELATLLLDATPDQRSVLGLEGSGAEPEAAEQLWAACRPPDSRPRAGVRLGRMLLTGAPGLPAEPAALDEIREAFLDWGVILHPDEARDLALAFLERGAPGDLLPGLSALAAQVRERSPLAGPPLERGLAALRVHVAPEPVHRLAAAIVVREGWDREPGDGVSRVAPADRAWAEQELAQLRQGHPGARLYLETSGWLLASPLPHEGRPCPHPLDVLALEGGTSVRRPVDAEQLMELSRVVELEVAGEGRGRVRYDRVAQAAGTGFSLAQWALVGRLDPRRRSDPALRCWAAAAGIEPGACPPARAELGRILLLGEWGRRDPARAVRYLRDAMPTLSAHDDRQDLSQAKAWFALAQLLGEGTQRDEPQALDTLRALDPAHTARLVRSPGRAAWLHVVLSDLGPAPETPVGELTALLERAAADGVPEAQERLEALAGQGEAAARAALERLAER